MHRDYCLSTQPSKLIELNLQSLESRRLRYDLIEIYKIIHAVNNVNKCTWFSMLADNPIGLQECQKILFHLVPNFVEPIFVNIF